VSVYLGERLSHQLQCHLRLPQHHFTRHPQNAISREFQPPLPLGVERNALGVIAAIDLNYEPHRRSVEIHDVTEQRHLPLEANAKLPPLEQPPQRRLALGG
jgi:hypothetical protein